MLHKEKPGAAVTASGVIKNSSTPHITLKSEYCKRHSARLSEWLESNPPLAHMARIHFQDDYANYDHPIGLGIGTAYEIETFCAGYDISLLTTENQVFAIMPVEHWCKIMGAQHG